MGIGDLLYIIEQERRMEEMDMTGRCADCECELSDDYYCHACKQYKIDCFKP